MDLERTPEPAPDAALALLELAVRLSQDASATAPALEAPIPAEVWRAVTLRDLRQALDAALVGKNPEAALDLLQAGGCFAVLVPEVEALVGMGDSEFRHKDVWKHTKLVVRQAVPRLEIRWGALLHDIGKPKTRKVEDDGTVTFYGHAELGAAMFRRRVRARLGFDGALGDRIHFLILHHLRASQYEADWTDSAVRRFYKQMGDGLRDLLDLSRADITTKRPEKRRRGVRQISELGKRIQSLREVDERTPALPKGLGTVLSETFGVPPSKQLGEIRRLLEQDVDDGVLERGRECAYYEQQIAENRARYGLG